MRSLISAQTMFSRSNVDALAEPIATVAMLAAVLATLALVALAG